MIKPRTSKRSSSSLLSDNDINELQRRLDAVPPPCEPLDVSALDGFLVGVLLQPKAPEQAHWLRFVTDVEGRAPRSVDPRVHTLLLRRYAELDRAIEQRTWFDPWVFELDAGDAPSDAVLGWVAGFVMALELFPELLHLDPGLTLEALAQLYAYMDPADLEDADELLAEIETLEPPRNLAEAVESLVRATLLLADVTRPRAVTSRNT